MAGTRRGGYAKGRQRRDAILRAANEVFAARGFHRASLATIATRVGLSEPGLLHHFPSKEHLLLELLALRHEHDGERVARALADHEGFLDALLGLCRENQDTAGLVRLFTILVGESVDDEHPAHDWMVERYRTLRARFVARIEDEQREGRVAAGLDARAVAPQLIAMFDGLQLQWLLDPDEVDLAAVFADFLDRLRPAAPPQSAGPRRG
jgi:AcrR family transcriptional regulator